MSRYIKANELNRAKFHPLPYTHIIPADIKDAEAYEMGWNDAIDAIIENEPTADVVEVVRCRDCKYRIIDPNDDWCGCTGCDIDPNGFCSDGERREDERTD